MSWFTRFWKTKRLVAICKDCKHRRVEGCAVPAAHPKQWLFYVCSKHGRSMNYVSGKPTADYFTSCFKINTDGKCRDFEAVATQGRVES